MEGMNSGIWLDVSSLGILALLFVIYQYRDDIPIKQNKILFSMVKLAFFSTLCSIPCELYVEGKLIPSDWGYYIFKGLTLLAQTTIAFLFMLYVRELVKRKDNPQKMMFWYYFPYAVQIAMVLTNLLSRSRDLLEGPRISVFGLPSILFLGISSYFIIFSVYLIFSNLPSLTPYIVLALCAYFVFAYAGFLWQWIDPNIRISNFTLTLGLLNLYLTVQNPEEIIDGQTGCLNRKAFIKTASADIEGKREMMIIVTAIKEYAFLTALMDSNASEALLRHPVTALSPFVKDADLYRIAEDQFALVLKRPDARRAEEIGYEAIRQFLLPWETSTLTTTVSGYCCVVRYPTDFTTVDEFFALTGQLRQQGNEKEGRANIINVATLDLQAGKRRQMVSNLVLMAEERNITVMFQPVFCAKDNGVTCLRASLALHNPDVGLVGQDEFMPIAERNRSIFRFSEYLIRSCCSLLGERIIQAKGFTHLTVMLSSSQWLQFGLAELINGYIAEQMVDRDSISMRISCQALNQAPAGEMKTLLDLESKGIPIVITGYGGGYIEMDKTFRLPRATISVASELFWAAREKGQSELIISSSVALFRQFNYACCVEGIRTEEEKQECLRMGVDYLTGPLFGKPCTLEELDRVH
jgi:EAL domain-containing protein (putative c-di-GMP-specific phosphodiesterase class I)/GGDEF domain-containing protein